MTSSIPARLPNLAARAITAAVVLVMVAACATDREQEVATTTITTVATTTSTTAATTAPTTAATFPPPTYSDVETAIREAHTRVMTELFARDERVTAPEAVLPLAEELVIDPMLQRIKESIEAKAISGERSVDPGYVSNITEVQIVDEANAWVFDCSQGRGERYSADGELLVEGDDFFKLRQSVMVLVDGRWMMSDLYTGGDVRCDPAD